MEKLRCFGEERAETPTCRRRRATSSPGERLVIEAAQIKADHPMAHADAFAAALTIAGDRALLAAATAEWPATT